MTKILSVVGARPNFVKLAGVEPWFSKLFHHIVVHTGQHYDYELSTIFFEHLKIREPDYYLGVGSGTHGYQVGETIKRLEKVLIKEKPDLVIVYGDTNSTLAAALASIKAGFLVGHVEAGLRSFDMKMPEEINRRVTDHISDLLFAPTQNAIRNLKEESVLGKIYLTGDVHVDVLKRWVPIADERSQILKILDTKPKEYLVVTVHRAENTDNPNRLKNIVEALLKAKIDHQIIFPIHPRTYKALSRLNLINKLKASENIVLTKPVGYLDFIKLIKYSWKVITDSGGVQKEAYLLGVPCIVLREKTEWVELVDAGWVKLVGTEPNRIIGSIKTFEPRKITPNLLGDGNAGEKIANIIKNNIMK